VSKICVKSSKKSSKKVQKKVRKKVRIKVGKKVRKIIIKYYKLQREGGEGRGGEVVELSFQCLRPSTVLRAAGKNII
jgi:hypothetical protein